MIRLLRVAKLQRELSLVANRYLSTHAFMVMKIVAHLLMMLAINHVIACCWYGVGSSNPDGRNWLAKSELEEATFIDRYIWSLHWALTQFTPSTNNIAPDNGWERFFAIWVILLAMGVFSSFVGSISSTVSSLRAARVEHIKRHAKLLQFFIERNLSLELYGRVQAAIRKDEVKVRLQETEVSLLQRLPHQFKLHMHEEMFMGLLTSLPFWPRWSYSEDSVFFQRLCHGAVVEVAASPGEFPCPYH